MFVVAVPKLALTSPVLAIYNAPLTPTPPVTTNAPVVVLVLTVPELAVTLPALTFPTRYKLGDDEKVLVQALVVEL